MYDVWSSMYAYCFCIITGAVRQQGGGALELFVTLNKRFQMNRQKYLDHYLETVWPSTNQIRSSETISTITFKLYN